MDGNNVGGDQDLEAEPSEGSESLMIDEGIPSSAATDYAEPNRGLSTSRALEIEHPPEPNAFAVGSCESAEREGFDVLHMNDLNNADTSAPASPPTGSDDFVSVDEPKLEVADENQSTDQRENNSDSPHSLQIDEDPEDNPMTTDDNHTESTSSQKPESTPTPQPVPEGNKSPERQDPYADVAKDPLLGHQRPSNEVMQLLEQQAAEEKKLKDEQEKGRDQPEPSQPSATPTSEPAPQPQASTAPALNPSLIGSEIPFEFFAAASGGQIPASALQNLHLVAAQTAAASQAGDVKTQLTNPFSQNTVAAITQQLAASSQSAAAAATLPAAPSQPSIPPTPQTSHNQGFVNPTTVSLQQSSEQRPVGKRREVYRWQYNTQIYAMAWSYKKYESNRLRMACSSIKDSNELLRNTMCVVEYDEEKQDLVERCNVFIGTPSSELHFIPDQDPNQPDLIASATKEMRVYSYHPNTKEVVLEAKLQPNKSYAYAGPLTSVDWNETDPSLLGGSSVDSTCTIWDIAAEKAIATVPPVFDENNPRLKYKLRTQLIAHEMAVHDMAFSKLGSGRDYFASCSADGSVRMFDLRNLKHSTILYEHPDKQKLNHISWNRFDSSQFATVAHASNELVVCDVRMPCRHLQKFSQHTKPINSIDWAPHTAQHLCSGSSDRQALIWQVQHSDEPILAYPAEGEITRIRWSAIYSNWIGISFNNSIEILRV